jgi:exosortase A-associated hydrolase 2
MPATPFFLPTAGGQRFCLLHASGQWPELPVASILYIHPFAEELNRSRRMAALQCQAFARAGFEVLQMDLGGSGDSAGHFADATWEGWVADILAARDWLAARQQKRLGDTPIHAIARPDGNPALWLWGLRAGCLVAAEVARQAVAQPANLLFWQPVTQGAVHLAQFLRLKVATDLVRGGNSENADRAGKAGPAGEVAANANPTPRQLLAQGNPVEIGGYALSPALATGLEAAHLNGLPVGSRVICLEFTPATSLATDAAAVLSLSPALASQIDRWQNQGVNAQGFATPGAPFWQTPEVEVVTEAIDLAVKQLLAVQAQAAGSRQEGR